MSGRYNSKVFNFFSRQSLRLRDQSAQTWRNVKLAAVWGVQILLYPIYVGFQATRLIGKQLQQSGRQVLPRLRSAGKRVFSPESIALTTSDRPIQQTLQSVAALPVHSSQGQEVLLLPAETKPDVERELALYLRQHSTDPTADLSASAIVTSSAETTPDIAAVRIQGVASLLETRGIVLVTTRNQILDILTLEQQTQLARRIVAETANYLRQQRLFMPPRANRLFVSNALPLPKESPNALLPIRLFQKAMAWMQRGSVAVSADLFQESQLALPASSQTLALAEANSFEQLRSAQPSWVSVEAQFYDWLEQTGRVANRTLIAGLEQGLSLLTYLTDRQPNHRFPNPPQLPELSPGQLPAPLPDQAAPRLTLPPAQPDWMNRIDRWLSKIPGLQTPPASPSQLDAEVGFQQNVAGQMAASGQAPGQMVQVDVPGSSLVPSSIGQANPIEPKVGVGQSFRNWIQNSLRQILPSRTALSRTERATQWELTDTADLEKAIKLSWNKSQSPAAPTSPASASLTAQPRSIPVAATRVTQEHKLEVRSKAATDLVSNPAEEAAIMPSQNWIETEAQLVGYVKHPLEQLLEWLDQGMLWLEERFAQIWQWFTRSRG